MEEEKKIYNELIDSISHWFDHTIHQCDRCHRVHDQYMNYYFTFVVYNCNCHLGRYWLYLSDLDLDDGYISDRIALNVMEILHATMQQFNCTPRPYENRIHYSL